MATCVQHPDVPSSTRCRLCEQFYCSGCLAPVEKVGLVCAECEALLSPYYGEHLLSVVPKLRRQARAQVPPPRLWWGWEILFGFLLLLPTSLLATALWGQMVKAGWMTQLSLEPRRPAMTTRHLLEISSALEHQFTSQGRFPGSLEALLTSNLQEQTFLDPYGKDNERLLYQSDGRRYLLCSRGPDRVDNEGERLDRFEQKGDLCVGDLVLEPKAPPPPP